MKGKLWLGKTGVVFPKIPALGGIAEENCSKVLKLNLPFGKCCSTGYNIYFTKKNVENKWLFRWENFKEIQN